MRKPNFLLIVSDDLTYNDLSIYGGQNARTPNLDKLAAEGLVFEQAYLAMAMCQPCRAELYTGQYPMRNGCAWNHSASRNDITSMPHHLREVGYRVGIAGKVHVKPDHAYPFEMIEGFDRSCTRNPTLPHSVDGITEFMQRDDDEPFCLVVGLVDPHVPWVMGDADTYPPEEIKLPPHIADTEITREATSHYLAEVTYMDGQVGEILQALNDTGKDDTTLVMFTSEQGAQYPGCKWTNWNLGLHTALITRWPGQIVGGQRTTALVQYADVLPTFLDAAGGDCNKDAYDGTSFLPALQGQSEKHRDFVYGMHNNIPEGPPYPIRTIFDGEYHYIRNLLPEHVYVEKHLMGLIRKPDYQNYWGSWLWEAWENERTSKLVNRYMSRPAEELYRHTEDPFEHQNLADDPDYQEIKARLSKELDQWMKAQGDPGVPQDTVEAHAAAKRGEHLYGVV